MTRIGWAGPLIGVICVLGAAVVEPGDREPTGREILESHLSHGIGTSPFDSGLWRDDVNASIDVSLKGTCCVVDVPPGLVVELKKALGIM